MKTMEKIKETLEIMAIEKCNILVINDISDYIDWLSEWDNNKVDLKQLKEVNDLLNKQGYVYKLENGEYGDGEMAINELISRGDWLEDFKEYYEMCNK